MNEAPCVAGGVHAGSIALSGAVPGAGPSSAPGGGSSSVPGGGSSTRSSADSIAVSAASAASAVAPLRIALVGCGRIAANHLAAIEAHAPRARIVDVCDVDAAALDAAAQRTGARAHASLSSMLVTSDAQLVSLCTPSGLHAAQAIEAARSGRHVLSEKPMATRWNDGLAMVRACDDAGVRLFVVKQNRFNATLQLLRRAIERGRFGRIYLVTINVFWTRPQSYYDAARWRGTRDLDGGALMNQASHYVDLLDWLVGPVDRVYAETATLARSIEMEDTAVLAVRWKHGAVGSVNVTMLTYPRNFEGSVTVLGEHGTVRIGGVAVNEVREWQFDSPDADDEAIATASYATHSVYGFGHPAYYGNVLDVLQGGAQPSTDGRAGLRSLELLCAAYDSARTRMPVSLPLPVDGEPSSTGAS